MTRSLAQYLVVVFRSKVFWLQVSEFVVFQKLDPHVLLKFIEIPVKPSQSYGHFLVWHSQERRSFQKLGCPQNSALYLGTREAAFISHRSPKLSYLKIFRDLDAGGESFQILTPGFGKGCWSGVFFATWIKTPPNLNHKNRPWIWMCMIRKCWWNPMSWLSS